MAWEQNNNRWRRPNIVSETPPPARRRRLFSAERVRTYGIAIVLGIVVWTAYYWTLGSHRIERLDEFAAYLKGANLYAKHDVARLTWDCAGLRRQFETAHIRPGPGRMSRDGATLVFLRDGLDLAAFKTWVETARHRVKIGQDRKVTSDTMLLTAMIARLFPTFRFESGELARTVANPFPKKCRE